MRSGSAKVTERREFGKTKTAEANGYSSKSFDILASFLDVLGKPVAQAPDNYARGDHRNIKNEHDVKRGAATKVFSVNQNQRDHEKIGVNE